MKGHAPPPGPILVPRRESSPASHRMFWPSEMMMSPRLCAGSEPRATGRSALTISCATFRYPAVCSSGSFAESSAEGSPRRSDAFTSNAPRAFWPVPTWRCRPSPSALAFPTPVTSPSFSDKRPRRRRPPIAVSFGVAHMHSSSAPTETRYRNNPVHRPNKPISSSRHPSLSLSRGLPDVKQRCNIDGLSGSVKGCPQRSVSEEANVGQISR